MSLCLWNLYRPSKMCSQKMLLLEGELISKTREKSYKYVRFLKCLKVKLAFCSETLDIIIC